MNVLIITPDAVGSTLLQRMLTIYMQFHDFDRPVINLHELTNGLAKYYSPEFNRELVGKKAVENWGYFQSLQQVIELLSSVDHYKTSRLAHYHIQRRGDTIEQQVPFYNYLNENFYIIACRRANVFEHALSMTLNTVTKKLNVYNPYEKINSFYEIYQSGITLDSGVFVNRLNAYKQYIHWSEQYFNIGSYFNYEKDVPNLEQYILDLPVFSKQSNRVTWDKNFGLSFNTWNQLHYARSDLTSLNLNKTSAGSIFQIDSVDQRHAIKDHTNSVLHKPSTGLMTLLETPSIQREIQNNGIVSFLSQDKQQKLAQHIPGYNQAQDTINQMIELGIIINGPPIKKQTLGEKRKIIKNFDALVDIYNKWAQQNQEIASPIGTQDLIEKSQLESSFWNSLTDTTGPQLALQPNQQ
jgi:hypothetical protein